MVGTRTFILIGFALHLHGAAHQPDQPMMSISPFSSFSKSGSAWLCTFRSFSFFPIFLRPRRSHSGFISIAQVSRSSLQHRSRHVVSSFFEQYRYQRIQYMCNIITEAFQEFMLVNTAYVLLLSQVRKSAQHQNGRRGGRPDQFLHLAPCLAAVRAGSFGQLGYFAPRGRSRPCGPTSTARSRWR